MSRLDEGITYVEKDLAVYPLWICPSVSRAGAAESGEHGALSKELIEDEGKVNMLLVYLY